MIPRTTAVLVLLLQPCLAQQSTAPASDWLLDTKPAVSGLQRSDNDQTLTLSNGLLSVQWRMSPAVARVSLRDFAELHSQHHFNVPEV